MNEFIKRWQFVRSETLEILWALTDEQLLFRPPGEKWQPLYYQFGCIGRTQLVYAMAAKTGVMDFRLFGSVELPDKKAYRTAESIQKFLESCEQTWRAALKEEKDIVWPDGNKPIQLHISNLAEHERLHHGQMITYFTLAGFELPENFTKNWSLQLNRPLSKDLK